MFFLNSQEIVFCFYNVFILSHQKRYCDARCMNFRSNMSVTHVQKCEKNVVLNLKKYKCTTCSCTIYMFCAGTFSTKHNDRGGQVCGIKHFRSGQVWHQTFQG